MAKLRKLFRKPSQILKPIAKVAPGAIAGFLTGGPVGAVAGGALAARRKSNAYNLRNLLQSSLAGLGGGAGASLLGLGGGGAFSGPAAAARGALGKLFGGGGLPGGGGQPGEEGGEPGTEGGGPDYGRLLALLGGGGLLARGLIQREDPYNIETPTQLSPEEQAALERQAGLEEEAGRRGLEEFGGRRRRGIEELQASARTRDLGELEEATKRIEDLLAARGLSTGGAFAAATTKEAARLARERGQRFEPFQLETLGGEAGRAEAIPGIRPGFMRAGTERLFGQRDIAQDLSFQAEQLRRAREAEREQALLGLGGTLTTEAFGGDRSPTAGLGRTLGRTGRFLGGLFGGGRRPRTRTPIPQPFQFGGYGA